MKKVEYNHSIELLKYRLKGKKFLDIDLTGKTTEFLSKVAEKFEYDYIMNKDNQMCLRIYNN